MQTNVGLFITFGIRHQRRFHCQRAGLGRLLLLLLLAAVVAADAAVAVQLAKRNASTSSKFLERYLGGQLSGNIPNFYPIYWSLVTAHATFKIFWYMIGI